MIFHDNILFLLVMHNYQGVQLIGNVQKLDLHHIINFLQCHMSKPAVHLDTIEHPIK